MGSTCFGGVIRERGASPEKGSSRAKQSQGRTGQNRGRGWARRKRGQNLPWLEHSLSTHGRHTMPCHAMPCNARNLAGPVLPKLQMGQPKGRVTDPRVGYCQARCMHITRMRYVGVCVCLYEQYVVWTQDHVSTACTTQFSGRNGTRGLEKAGNC